MEKKEKCFYEGWSEVMSSIKVTETMYVFKNNHEKGRYKVISVANDYHNSSNQIVTFYNIRDEEGKVCFMKLEEFVERFEAIQL